MQSPGQEFPANPTKYPAAHRVSITTRRQRLPSELLLSITKEMDQNLELINATTVKLSVLSIHMDRLEGLITRLAHLEAAG